jgi:hypothetical protein
VKFAKKLERTKYNGLIKSPNIKTSHG